MSFSEFSSCANFSQQKLNFRCEYGVQIVDRYECIERFYYYALIILSKFYIINTLEGDINSINMFYD